MSKSKLTGIAPDADHRPLRLDAYRYYFLRAIAFGQDGSLLVGGHERALHVRARQRPRQPRLAGDRDGRRSTSTGVLPEPDRRPATPRRALARRWRAVAAADAAIDRLAIHEAISAAISTSSARSTATSPSRSPGRSPRTILGRRGRAAARPRSCTPRPSRCGRSLSCTHPVMPKATALLWEALGADVARAPSPTSACPDAGRWGQLPAGAR